MKFESVGEINDFKLSSYGFSMSSRIQYSKTTQ